VVRILPGLPSPQAAVTITHNSEIPVSPNLTHISSDHDLAALDVDAVVIGITAGDKGIELGPGAADIDTALAGKLAETLQHLGATGTPGQVVKLATLGATVAPVIAAVGLGEQAGDATVIRNAAGAAIRALAGTHRVAVALGTGYAALAYAAAEGAALASYDFTSYKSEQARQSASYRAPVSDIVIVNAHDADRAELDRVMISAHAVHQVRDWVNTPPNHLRPDHFAQAAVALATQAGLDIEGLTVEVLDDTELKAQGYGGITAVGSGSDAGPRLVTLRYQPASYQPRDSAATNLPHVALVGKGITFDTGGISIKPAAKMHEMKSDMAGAAAVVAAVVAIAQLRLPVRVTAYVPIAENMPSGSAYRPGDVITLYGGQQVEILNTDAEGRLILGDAIGRACQDQPDYLIETSTLTGGQVIALGHRICGVMGTDKLCERIIDAGKQTGEQMWQMPLAQDVRTGMDSSIADFSQINSSFDRAGHMLQGGLFLAECVTDDIAWAHIDIAGPAYNGDGPHGFTPKGGTGVPVRTLVEVVERIGTAKR
jgi:leucyl aminopeptidase